MKCKWKECPIRIGFEIYYQHEDDEQEARKRLYPLLEKFLKLGTKVKGVKETLVKGE